MCIPDRSRLTRTSLVLEMNRIIDDFIGDTVRPYGYVVWNQSLIRPIDISKLLALNLNSCSRRKISDVLFSQGRDLYVQILKRLCELTEKTNE
jgi:hypothetical protein